AVAHRPPHPFPARRGARARTPPRRPHHARGARGPVAARRRGRGPGRRGQVSGGVGGPRRTWRRVDGIVLLDKPAGASSTQVLQRVRRLLQAAKAGHAGTLDPMATGMLPLCFGQATKACGQLLGSAKAYRATLRLGVATDTGDAEGQVVGEAGWPELSETGVADTLATLVGT